MAMLRDDPWQVQDWDFPKAGTAGEQLRFLLNYAVLAPSGHNTQPWRFRISGNEVALYCDRSRALPVVDPSDREMLMGCGAALFHLRTAIRHFGFEDEVHTFPDLEERNLLAYVRFGHRREPAMEDHRLFMAIKHRRTNRSTYDERPVPEFELGLLARAVGEEHIGFHLASDPSRKREVAALIAEGDRVQGRDQAFRRELASWVRPNLSDSRDGIPGYAHGVGDLLSYAEPLVLRTFDWGDGRAARDRQLAEGSPALLVLTSESDDPPAWLATGQALDRLLLTATSYGLHTSFLNQPVEVADLRPQLAALVGGETPQVVLRMGYGLPVRATPRRPVHEVLTRIRYA